MSVSLICILAMLRKLSSLTIYFSPSNCHMNYYLGSHNEGVDNIKKHDLNFHNLILFIPVKA